MTHVPDSPLATTTLSRTRSRLTLLLIVAMFFSSFGVAAGLFFSGWQPSAHGRNYGELLRDPVDLNGSALILADATQWTWNNDSEQWTALARLPSDCDSACWQRTAMLLKVRTSLGRHAPQLRLLLLDQEIPPALRGSLLPLQSAATVRPLPLPALAETATAPELWLVDPHGYAVLHYRPGFDPSKLRKDLGKLLK